MGLVGKEEGKSGSWVSSWQGLPHLAPFGTPGSPGGGIVLEGELRGVVEGVVMWGLWGFLSRETSSKERVAS